MSRPTTPRERLAVELRDRIITGDFIEGEHLLGIKQRALERGRWHNTDTYRHARSHQSASNSSPIAIALLMS